MRKSAMIAIMQHHSFQYIYYEHNKHKVSILRLGCVDILT
jgi:hypothetical protein